MHMSQLNFSKKKPTFTANRTLTLSFRSKCKNPLSQRMSWVLAIWKTEEKILIL